MNGTIHRMFQEKQTCANWLLLHVTHGSFTVDVFVTDEFVVPITGIRYFNWTVIFCNCIRKLDHTNTKLHVEWLHVDFHAVCQKDIFLFVLLSACDSRWVLVWLIFKSFSGFHQIFSQSACTGLISRRISYVHTSHISRKNDHWY